MRAGRGSLQRNDHRAGQNSLATNLGVGLSGLSRSEEAAIVQDVAMQLGVRPTTLRKVLDGRAVALQTLRKLQTAVSNGQPASQPRPSADRLRAVYKLYRRYGALAPAERVRQLLVNGARWGMFQYPQARYPVIERSKLRKDFALLLTQDAVAHANGVPVTYVKALCKQFGCGFSPRYTRTLLYRLFTGGSVRRGLRSGIVHYWLRLSRLSRHARPTGRALDAEQGRNGFPARRTR